VTNYILKRNGRRLPKSGPFDSYDKARAEARRMIRTKVTSPMERLSSGWDRISRNPPSIGDFGYEIVRKAA